MPYTTSRSIKPQKKFDAHVSNPKRVSAPLSPPPEALIDMRELLQFLKLGKTKISELINQEGLPVYKFGHAYRFDRNEVWQWLQNRRQML
jgi:excisionase family DNA binding protein